MSTGCDPRPPLLKPILDDHWPPNDPTAMGSCESSPCTDHHSAPTLHLLPVAIHAPSTRCNLFQSKNSISSSRTVTSYTHSFSASAARRQIDLRVSNDRPSSIKWSVLDHQAIDPRVSNVWSSSIKWLTFEYQAPLPSRPPLSAPSGALRTAALLLYLKFKICNDLSRKRVKKPLAACYSVAEASELPFQLLRGFSYF